MRIPRFRISLAVLCGGLLAHPVGAADGVREYNDPGYHRIGVYTGGPASYFDYSLAKMSLRDTFPNKRAFWEKRRVQSQRNDSGDAGSPHTVFVVYAGIRGGASFEVCRNRLDAWLKPEPEIPTYPDTIAGHFFG